MHWWYGQHIYSLTCTLKWNALMIWAVTCALKCAVRCAVCTAADIVCGPEFHISGICLHRRYTQAWLASCPQPSHPSFPTWHWSNKSKTCEKQLKETAPGLPDLLARPFYSSWLKGLTLSVLHNFLCFFALFSNHPVHSFVHRSQRSGRNTRSG